MSLSKKVISSLRWLLLLRYLTRAIDVVKYAIVTRFIVPSDLGSFLLATTIVLTFEALSDTGFQFAFIQKQRDIGKYAKTLWFLSIARGILIGICLIITAPLFTWFFKIDVLLPLILVMSIIPIVKGIQSPYVYLFQKNLEFRNEFSYKIFPSLITSIIFIILALIWKNPLGLAFALVLGAAIETMTSFFITKSRFPLPFSVKLAKELFSYGKHLTVGGVFTLLVTQIDSLFVGRVFGTTTLALYELSFKLANIAFTEITDIISRVSFPLFSKIQYKKSLLLKSFKLNLLATTLPAVCITIILFFFAEDILIIAFGSDYKNAAVILKILSIYGLLRAVTGPAGPLFLAIGKPNLTSMVSILNFIFLLLLIYPLSFIFGIYGVAIAMVVSYLCILPFIGYHVYAYFAHEKS